MPFVKGSEEWVYLRPMLGGVDGQYKPYATGYQKLQLKQQQVGQVGKWLHDIRVLCLANWRSKNSREVGRDNEVVTMSMPSAIVFGALG